MWFEAESGRSILVVEDEPAAREGLAFLLEAVGHCVSRAANGREALDLLRSGPLPDVILLDLFMPVMDGADFRREQQRDPALAAVPVVLVSGAGDLDQWAAALGAIGLLRKPLDPGRL